MCRSKINFKKMFFIMFITYFAFLFGGFAVRAENSTDYIFPNENESSSEFSRAQTFPNGITCFEKFKCFKEEIVSINAIKNYRRTIEVSKIYKKKSKKNTFKTLATCNAKIVISYDKEKSVQIRKYSYDVKHNTPNKKWSLMNVGEIYPQDKSCLLSTKCVLYKEKSGGVHNYVMDGHFDVLCTCNGNIGINTDLH